MLAGIDQCTVWQLDVCWYAFDPGLAEHSNSSHVHGNCKRHVEDSGSAGLAKYINKASAMVRLEAFVMRPSLTKA
jgi:hypothetical protein